MKKHGRLTLDGAMDVSVTDAEALVTALSWCVEKMGGRVVDVRTNCVLARFDDREYTIGVQEVGIWGARQRATPDALIAKGVVILSYQDVTSRARVHVHQPRVSPLTENSRD